MTALTLLKSPFSIAISLVSRSRSISESAGEPDEVGLSAIYSIGEQVQTPTSWQIRATVLPTIRFSPPAIHLGSESIRREAIEREIAIEAIGSVTRIESSSNPFWAVEIAPNKQASPGNQFRMKVRARDIKSPQRVADTIRLTPITREGQSLPAKEIKIDGDIVDDVVAVPAQVYHGRQKCGTTLEEAVTLRSLTNRRFEVQSVKATNSSLEIARSKVDSSTTEWVYSLRLRCDLPGSQAVSAVFVIRDEDGTQSEVTVPVRYVGLEGS